MPRRLRRRHSVGKRHVRPCPPARRWPLQTALMLLAASLVPGPVGCGRAWRPPLSAVQTADADVGTHLRLYLAPLGSELTYRRTSLLNDATTATKYVTRVHGGGRSEGEMSACGVDSLGGHLARKERAAEQFAWPHPWGPGAAGFFLEFEPPLAMYPQVVCGSRRYECGSRLVCYGAKGQRLYEGRVTRALELEGYETVTFNGRDYPNCLRLRAETKFRIPWIARVNLTEYCWLARGVGVVRLLRHWDGLMLLFLFEDVVQYELVSMEPPASQPDNAPVAGGPRPWRRCAVYLCPALPQPRLSGLVVEETAPPADATEQSRDRKGADGKPPRP